MKQLNTKASVVLLLLILIAFTGCYRDVIIPATVTAKPPQSVSFKNQIIPLVVANCAKSGCHVNGSQKPFMDADQYKNIVNGGFVNTIIPDQSQIYTMLNGQMGQYIPSNDDIQLIYDWIRNGAPNN